MCDDIPEQDLIRISNNIDEYYGYVKPDIDYEQEHIKMKEFLDSICEYSYKNGKYKLLYL